MGRRSAPALSACLAIVMSAGSPARGQQDTVLVPVSTIYPGDTLSAAMLREAQVSQAAPESVCCATAAIGRIARRTLLAGRPIPVDSLEDQRAVRNGATVRLLYTQPGVAITATGQALQAAGVGEAIRVRNVDSGVVLSGVVAPDGVVMVDK